jgi:hypothetical protein
VYLDGFGHNIVNFDAEFEAQLIKFLVRIRPPDCSEQMVANKGDVGHR